MDPATSQDVTDAKGFLGSVLKKFVCGVRSGGSSNKAFMGIDDLENEEEIEEVGRYFHQRETLMLSLINLLCGCIVLVLDTGI